MHTKPLSKLGWVPLIVLALTALACSLLGGSGGGGSTGGRTLFEDDFSDTSSGWDRVSESTYTTDYEDDAYTILVDDTESFVWANPGTNFTDVVVTVEATKTGGPDDNNLGVICRYQDTDNFYFGAVSSDGYAGISKILDGEQEWLNGDGMEESDVIEQGAATNTIVFSCVGDTLSLNVNGEDVMEVSDSDFDSGDVGLTAAAYGEAGTQIGFDNFVVKAP